MFNGAKLKQAAAALTLGATDSTVPTGTHADQLHVATDVILRSGLAEDPLPIEGGSISISQLLAAR
jgi:hypothetical protein